MNKTTKCQHCGKDVPLPFRCPYCNQYFCVEHRLPENHACPESWRARVPRPEAPPVITERRPERVPYEYTAPHAPRPAAKIFWFSSIELKHIALGALLVMGVGLSITFLRGYGPVISVGLALVLTLSFVLHELAHKLSAQHFGLWAEFRLTVFGALITLLSMLPSPFKIISPGAVVITGFVTKETAGKTALAGPLTNIMLSLICAAAAPSLSNMPSRIIPIFGAWINAFIAILNLIPFGMMDGLKIFRWNKIAWTAVFIISLILGVFTYVYLP